MYSWSRGIKLMVKLNSSNPNSSYYGCMKVQNAEQKCPWGQNRQWEPCYLEMPQGPTCASPATPFLALAQNSDKTLPGWRTSPFLPLAVCFRTGFHATFAASEVGKICNIATVVFAGAGLCIVTCYAWIDVSVAEHSCFHHFPGP